MMIARLSQAIFVILVFGLPSATAREIRTQAVLFAQDGISTVIHGRITGYQTVDYTLRARSGQAMNVKLRSKHSANYFNVLPPGSNDVAIFTGQTDGSEWTGILPENGEYKLRVYLMRSAARRNEVANFRLTVSVSNLSDRDLGQTSASDVIVAGTPYHATGTIPCILGKAPKAECAFGVIRGKQGNAEVHVTLPGGEQRVFRFVGKKVSSGSSKVKAARRDDQWAVEVNNERYRIPEALIVGG